MDILNIRALNVSEKAMDGLSLRHKLISANIANVNTTGYQRSDVDFENQIKSILSNEQAKTDVKLDNTQKLMGVKFNPTLANQILNDEVSNETLAKDNYKDFNPTVVTDSSNPSNTNGNNVNIEQEMALLSKNGMRYNILAHLQGKTYKGMIDVIKAG